MISQSKERQVSIAATESSVFSISDNAKIFRILMDGLYADKIQSITREIWSNALDAHVQGGCPERPFLVSFPSPLDPTFRVRDYGVSLTHDQVMHMYTSLGYSTKEDSNDVVGKFGIGSKSPFAYTDNFTVTVYLDGDARFYSAMVGADGVPAIHLLGRAPTTEENGVEVAFPVETADTAAFAAAAFRISHGFDVKPEVLGDFGGWPTLPVLLEGADWKLLKGSIEGYGERAYARMGPVLYPINVNALNNITSEQRVLLGHTFVIDFPMGSLEMTASREELSYGRNDPTSASISRRIDEVLEELKIVALESYAACPTYFAACTKFREDTGSSQLPYAVKQLLMKKAQWRGLALQTSITLPRIRGTYFSQIEAKRRTNKTYAFKPHGVTTVVANMKTLIAYEDVSEGDIIKRSPARLREFVNHNLRKYDTILWVHIHDVKNQVGPLAQFFADFDGLDMIDVADMPLPIKARNSGGSDYVRRPVMVRVLTAEREFVQTEMDAEEFADGGIFVPMERMEAQRSPAGHTPSHVAETLRSLGALDQRVYGAPKSLQKKFLGDQWVNLYDHAREWFKAQDVNISENAQRAAAVREVHNDTMLDFLSRFVSKDDVSPDSLFWLASELHERAKADKTPSTHGLRELAESLDIAIPEADGKFAAALEGELTEVKAMMVEQYPLLEMLMSSYVKYSDKGVDLVTEYVSMCDNVSKTNHRAALAA